MGGIISTKIVQCPLEAPDIAVISQAAEIIKRGGLLVYPTDTFYGLGGDPGNELTIQRIFQVKGRPLNKPLPLIIGDTSCLEEWASDIPPVSKRLMDSFWPGPLTLILPAVSGLPSALTAGTGKIGIRWPKSPVATAIAKMADTAIISTSANLSEKGGIVDPEGLFKDMNGLVDMIIDSGVLPPTSGSTIVDACSEPIRIIREGDMPRDRLNLI